VVGANGGGQKTLGCWGTGGPKQGVKEAKRQKKPQRARKGDLRPSEEVKAKKENQ